MVDKKQLETLRQAIGDRATWFYLLIEEMKKRGYDYEGVAKEAVFKFGCLKGASMAPSITMGDFISQFANETVKEVFAMELKKLAEEEAVVEFNFCPLVDTWQKKHGLSVKETDVLCEYAVSGDHGVVENFPHLTLNVEQRIAAGDPCCRLRFVRKN